jgi:hypothetical protein
MRLVFTISIHRATNGQSSRRRTDLLKGHTKDLSANGLALLVPQVHLNGHHLAAESRVLSLELELSGAPPVSMQIVARRYERLEESELGCNYLIGARIVHMEPEDRAWYLNFISKELKEQTGKPLKITDDIDSLD